VGGQLSQITSLRKRKINDFHSCNTNASSTLPTDKSEREHLAWSMSVLFMAARQLALVNKTAQVDFEINVVCRQFAEWLRNIIQMHFQSFFGGNLFLSYDRVIAGFMARQVATTFAATCARHYCEAVSIAEANTRILEDMETSPLTVQSTNVAFSNALTHLVDTNLIMVNQFIRDRINTPVIPIEFLMDVFGTTPIGAGTPLFDELFGWLGQMMQCRQGGEMEYSSGYITVCKLGSLEDYQQKEAYLESYFGIAKNNFYTYVTAVRECASKSFDLSGFLCTDGSMLDFQRFVSRLGVGNDNFRLDGQQNGAQPQPPPPAVFDTYRNTYLFTQSSAEVQPAAQGNNNQPPPAAPSRGVGRCWVSLIQHLFVTAIQGNNELHADNMFTFGSNLTEFILSRCSPIQSTPAQSVLHESFQHLDNEVLPLRSPAGVRPNYFVRSINDYGAMNCGVGTELPPVLGAHPLEDVMHLGAWIQLYTILHAGTKPMRFQTFPLYNGRPPELVRGRTYPIMGPNEGEYGTIQLCPEHRRAAFIAYMVDGVWHYVTSSLADWWTELVKIKYMVAPLVFRNHAVFRDNGRGSVWVSSCKHTQAPPARDLVEYPVLDVDIVGQAEEQFLDTHGNYTLSRGNGSLLTLRFPDAHDLLVPIGTFILVKADALSPSGFVGQKPWVRGSVRYPDEGLVGAEINSHKVYFSLKVRERNVTNVRIACADPVDCLIMEEHSEIDAGSISTEAIVQPIADHAQQ